MFSSLAFWLTLLSYKLSNKIRRNTAHVWCCVSGLRKKNSTLTVTHDSTPMATFYWIVHTSKYLKSTSGQEREHWLRHEHDAHLANRKEHTTSRLHQLNQALQELGQRRKSNPRRLRGSIWVSSNVFDKMQELLLYSSIWILRWKQIAFSIVSRSCTSGSTTPWRLRWTLQ